jgi:hypothetical protein
VKVSTDAIKELQQRYGGGISFADAALIAQKEEARRRIQGWNTAPLEIREVLLWLVDRA